MPPTLQNEKGNLASTGDTVQSAVKSMSPAVLWFCDVVMVMLALVLVILMMRILIILRKFMKKKDLIVGFRIIHKNSLEKKIKLRILKS